MMSILNVQLVCMSCGKECRISDAIPCVNGGTGYGCPVADCGGVLAEITYTTGRDDAKS